MKTYQITWEKLKTSWKNSWLSKKRIKPYEKSRNYPEKIFSLVRTKNFRNQLITDQITCEKLEMSGKYSELLEKRSKIPKLPGKVFSIGRNWKLLELIGKNYYFQRKTENFPKEKLNYL